MKSEIQRCEWTDEVSEAFARIKSVLERKGTRIEDFDAAVAAHALALDGVLVTANLKHMVRVPGLEIEDWSKQSQPKLARLPTFALEPPPAVGMHPTRPPHELSWLAPSPRLPPSIGTAQDVGMTAAAGSSRPNFCRPRAFNLSLAQQEPEQRYFRREIARLKSGS